MNFNDELKIRTHAVQDIIFRYLPKEEGFTETVTAAINYSMKAQGKRIRPLLMQEAYRLFGGDDTIIEPFMAAIEMIHTHSLIHDDLPALDNDEYRRGQKTTHAVYGEAVAILSGDALLNYAYETALTAFTMSDDYLPLTSALEVLAKKTGVQGMLGGQSVDITNEGEPLSLEMLNFIYKSKTSALIECSMMIGAILAGAAPGEVKIMEEAGYCIGMAFQIQDDILDVTSTTEELGKPVLSDEKNHKTTYVTLKGSGQAQKDVKAFSEKALELLAGLSGESEFLHLLIEFLVTRKK